MKISEFLDCVERTPIIGAIHDYQWSDVLNSPVEILFYLKANILTVEQRITEAHKKGKAIFVHLDLCEGVGKDRAGLEFLANCGVDGVVTTRAQNIRQAKELGLLTVQRFFALDSKGLASIDEMINTSKPDLIEIMPGVVTKIIGRFSNCNIPVIAGGLIETNAEVTGAIGSGAIAVSTSCRDLWYNS